MPWMMRSNMEFVEIENFATLQLDRELTKDRADIDFDKIEEYIKAGANLRYVDSMGYSFSERAGLKGRLDVVARLSDL